MDWTLEVVVVPVADVDRAIEFYRDKLGFRLDHDTRAGDQRFAQLTPPGSGCSIVLSEPPPMTPGSLRGLQLVVADAYSARGELVERGVAAGDIEVIDERDGGTLFGFNDPDGNAWVVQQIKERADKPLLPRT
ncbi:catechol 2,3-dioxygenase-like lactoylglutathione lyase family enzyme [Mycobacterium sp. OAS707]|uniref:VOC family protein n=1 Tax=Mycobacterium sp. OAS707 TaxID=2663822 RepID=UPI00178C03AB|nr:VOC family protein [Mycobacterium sp. OAS707]MBE1546339.1 catechol 2,3-dioxygenase-like lactoylglutathione lyase family enzyme [Mycobacterium sp. OAS707]